VSLKKPALLSFHLECSVPCGFKAVLVLPEEGWETKQAEYLRGGHQGHLHGETLRRWNAYAALTVPAASLEATEGESYLVFEAKLAPERCAFAVEANGDVPAPISWKLTTYSTEKADTTWTPDDARARYFETTVSGWNAKDAERAAAAEAALARRVAEREARARGEAAPPLLKPVKVGKDAEVGEDAEQVELDPTETRRTLRRGGATVDAARAAAAAKAAAGLGLDLQTHPSTASSATLSAFRSLRRTAKGLPRAEDLVETAVVSAETYSMRESKLKSSIEESKARLAAYVARREKERETRATLAETKKSSFAEWRARETLARREDPSATWRAKRLAYLQSVKPERAEQSSARDEETSPPEAAEE
jgi:hypothetical protein